MRKIIDKNIFFFKKGRNSGQKSREPAATQESTRDKSARPRRAVKRQRDSATVDSDEGDDDDDRDDDSELPTDDDNDDDDDDYLRRSTPSRTGSSAC